MLLKSGLVKGEKLVSCSGCVIGKAQRRAGGCGKDAAGVTRAFEIRSTRGQKEGAAKKSLAKALRLFGNEGGLNSAADKRGWEHTCGLEGDWGHCCHAWGFQLRKGDCEASGGLSPTYNCFSYSKYFPGYNNFYLSIVEEFGQ